MNTEITERSKPALIEEIDFLETFNKSVIDSISDAILVIDPKTFKILGLNQAVLEQLGLRREVIGHFCYTVTHHTSTPCKAPNDICPIFDLIEKGVSVSVEHTHYDKNNKKIFVEVSAHPIRNPQGEIILITHIAKDITARKELQVKLVESEKLATVGELALTLANDLRNPLQAIQVASFWLKKDYSHLDGSPTGLKMLESISDSIKYSDNIITALLDFVSSKRPFMEKLQPNTIIEKVLGIVKIPNNVELIMELGVVPQIDADKNMLERVFMNIAKNGLEAMDNGGILRVSSRVNGEFVEVSFRDSGVGISETNLGKLFKPLFTTKSKGMGLGLAVCKRFVEAHEGSIKVQSEEEKGTEFRIKLPINQEKVNRLNILNSNGFGEEYNI
jgi:two-component system, sporulation sensor kinase A